MVEIRRFKREDVADVAEIERLCFDEPWSEKSLELLLDEKNAGFVALIDGCVHQLIPQRILYLRNNHRFVEL